MSITRINHFTAADDKADELAAFLSSLVPYISGCDGNLGCEVLRQSDNEHKFAVIEKWRSMEDHQRSLANFPSEEMQAAMTLFGAPPTGAAYNSIA
ncbi:MAG: putative quinol monooxygenase [Psychrobium sp.]